MSVSMWVFATFATVADCEAQVPNVKVVAENVFIRCEAAPYTSPIPKEKPDEKR